MSEEPKDNFKQDPQTPGGIMWPLKRTAWFLEKHLLWPLSDSFRKLSSGFKYRSPFAYIGATLMVAVTAGAVAAAVYFYNQSEDKSSEPLAATTAVPTETSIAPAPTPTPVTTPGQDTTPNSGNADTTLQGVVPSFTASETKKKSKKSKSQQLPGTVVRPAPKPDSAPLKVAHKFATNFANYEIGKKGAADKFSESAATKLVKDLKKNPPKLPASGQIPKATVVNVVKGKKNGDQMAVSVSLMRSGGASELRLNLTREKANGWLVSEVRG